MPVIEFDVDFGDDAFGILRYYSKGSRCQFKFFVENETLFFGYSTETNENWVLKE